MQTSGALAEIAILDYPGSQQSALHGLTDLFRTANRMAAERGMDGAPALRVSHWRLASEAGEGVVCAFDTHPGRPAQPVAVIVPPSLGGEPRGEPRGELLGLRTEPLARWLRSRHAAGATLCSVCAGALLLAETGLLDGRPATTHWALAETFAARFPAVRLDADKLIVEDADIITAGGVMAWIDLGLRLVDRLVGPTVMLATARFFLVDPAGREQRFYSTFAPRLHHGDAAILKVQHWLQALAPARVTLADMAAAAGLGQRTFLRRFQRAAGMNPTDYLQHLRVGKARELLEATVLPVEQVAWQVGYADAGAFRKVFQKIMGLPAGEYRRRFGIARAS